MSAELIIEDIRIALPKGGDRAFAVEDVSLRVRPGEVVCVVGESGSGKSTLAHAVLGLLPRGLAVTQGNIQLGDLPLLGQSLSALRQIRGCRISMIFQEPLSALNPLMRCGEQVQETLREHTQMSSEQMQERVAELLQSVGLSDHQRVAASYPFQLSGGQRQRVMIAMALALEPEILIADEPTTALDVTTQAQILRVLIEIQQRKGLGVLFITHDFGVVSEIADRVVVMKGGRIVEEGDATQVLRNPQQPYTQALLDAVPSSVPPEHPETDQPEDVLLNVEGLRKTYVKRAGLFKPEQQFQAVKGVSFTIRKGETVGLVGESGSGKSTIGRILAGLIPADAGRASMQEHDLLKAHAFEDKALR